MGFRHRIKGYLSRDRYWIPGTIAAIVSVTMWQLGAWKPLERSGYTALFNIRPEPGWNSQIVTIAIDEKSLQTYGQFPWRRDRYIELLDALSTARPAAIGFDILFLDPSPLDAQLATAIQTAGNAILARAGEGEEPVSPLNDAAAAIGHIIHEPDSDGISRQVTLWDEGIPGFSLAMLQVARDRSYEQLLEAIPAHAISHPYPDFDVRNAWINWPGKMESVPTYSFVDVVEGNVAPDAFANKIVLVGFVATGVDIKISPLQPVSGVYLHAAAIDNWLEGRFLKRLPNPIALLLLIGIATAMSWILADRSVAGRLGAILVLPVAWFTIALAAFTWGNWWIPVAAPIGSMLLALILVQLRDQYEKQQLLKLFAKQISPQMAQIVWERRGEIFQNGDLPPQDVTATVLFMDIRSFTTISESLSPPELLPWLNEYLEAMSDCIMDYGGIIDKYIGDAIMGVFGVPFPHHNPAEIQQDAIAAIGACLAMQKKLSPLNQRFKAEGKPLIRIGIGIHTGPLIAGSVGGKRRANYSVIGDTVNVAARVEPMNKQIVENNPYNLLVTGDTYRYVSDRYLGVQVAEMQLRGKQQETCIYAILGEK